MSRRSARATALDPFASHIEPRLVVTVTEDLLDGTSWVAKSTLPAVVDCAGFLSDTNPTMTVLAPSMRLLVDEGRLSILSVLVGVAGNIFHDLRSFQAAPTVQEGFARIHEMKNAARKLATLARGKSAPAPPADETVASMPLGPRTPALHAFLHDLLQMVDEPDDAQNSDDEAWARALAYMHRRDRRLRMFFSRLDEIVERLTVSDRVVAEHARLDPRSRRKGAPRDDARDWLLIRLMWIWRDAMGQDVVIYQPRKGGLVDPADAAPPEKSVLAFVCDILDRLEPVRPHELSALEKKLIELRPRIPTDSLFST